MEITLRTHLPLGATIGLLNRLLGHAWTETEEPEQEKLIDELRACLKLFQRRMDHFVCRQLPEATGPGYRLSTSVYYRPGELTEDNIAALIEFASRLVPLKVNFAWRDLNVRILEGGIAPVRETVIPMDSTFRPGFVTLPMTVEDHIDLLQRQLRAFAASEK